MRSIIKELFDDGFIETIGEGKYRLAKSLRVTYEGTVDMTSSGALYVKVEGMEKDIYVNQRRTNHALNGDYVRVAITRKGLGAKGNPEGAVVEVLRRSERNYVGVVDASENFAFVKVDSRKMPYDIFIPNRDLKGAQSGKKVVVKVTAWPETMKNPQGEIVDILGDQGDNDTEMHAILAEFDLPYVYPQKVTDEAEKIDAGITEAEIAMRRDMRDVPTLTIDPIDAKDFDDALSLKVLPDGNFEVGVHIADVTYCVKPGGIIDVEAQERATSVYLVDRTIPMLPERLSNFICSLRPGEDKLCFSVVLTISPAAKVLNRWFGRTVINSDRRFNYQQAQEIIEGKEDEMSSEIIILNDLAQKLRKDRFKNGSIAFERDEVRFDLDEKGKPVDVHLKEMKESNQLIEEYMLLANRSVAEFIGRKGGGESGKGGGESKTFVYRIHDRPDPEKINQLRNFVHKFGYVMTAMEGKGLAQDINRLMKDIHGTSQEHFISTLAIRSMSKAEYSTTNIGHYGLAFRYYTHFTAPIRRYPDMMVHRLLAHYLAGGKSENKDFYDELCKHSSEMEVRAADAERASVKYKMVEFMLDKIDQEFDGHISGITERGIYVELDSMIEGMVAIRDMTDDYYVFDPETYAVTGQRHKRTFTLGDQVRIRVTRADLGRKQLDFDLVASYDFDTREETLYYM